MEMDPNKKYDVSYSLGLIYTSPKIQLYLEYNQDHNLHNIMNRKLWNQKKILWEGSLNLTH